jgi:hypothetical protein
LTVKIFKEKNEIDWKDGETCSIRYANMCLMFHRERKRGWEKGEEREGERE